MSPYAMEQVEQPLYDTEDLKRMGQRVSLFVQPLGSTVMSIWRELRQKDYWETNMLQACQIEDPNEFHVRDISVLLYDKDGPLPVFDRTGLGNLWAKSYLQLSINQKTYWQGPLCLVADPVCQIGGLQTLMAIQDKAAISETMQILSYQSRNPLDLQIRRQENFTVQVTPYTPVCRQISVRVILNGRKLRSVM